MNDAAKALAKQEVEEAIRLLLGHPDKLPDDAGRRASILLDVLETQLRLDRTLCARLRGEYIFALQPDGHELLLREVITNYRGSEAIVDFALFADVGDEIPVGGDITLRRIY